jgi:hypothetical protein
LHIAPLVIIFTNRDAALTKAASGTISSAAEGTVRGASEMEAQPKAEDQVDAYINEREEEVKQLSQDNGPIVFLTIDSTFPCVVQIFEHGELINIQTWKTPRTQRLQHGII